MIIIVASIYLILGFLILVFSSIFLELGRPKDLFIAGFILLLGIFLILKQNIFEGSLLIFIFLNTILFLLLLFEIYSIRWNQLSDKERIKLKTFSEFLKNFSLFLSALGFAIKKLLSILNIFNSNKNNLIKKKWIRLESDSVNTNTNKKPFTSTQMESQKTKLIEKDIIAEGKKQSKITQSDKK